MTARDLIHGNTILCHGLKCRVLEVHSATLVVDFGNKIGVVMMSDASGIELTDDVLTEHEFLNSYDNRWFSIEHDWIVYEDSMVRVHEGWLFDRKISYLHELQNLMLILTGKMP